MSRYEQRLAADKSAIRERVHAVGDRVEKAIADAVQSLIARDRQTANRIILGDLPINREIRAIDNQCHAFVARHLPSARHLRFVSSVLQMNVAIERVGDYAVSISREGIQLSEPVPDSIAEEIRALADQVTTTLRQALKAFGAEDADLARATKLSAVKIERSYGRTIRGHIKDGIGRSFPDTFATLTVFSKLERVNDQAKNLCEETLFELTGETKPPKRYKVLFVDARCTLLAPLAEVLAKKAFPESGIFDCAGYDAGDALAPELGELAERLGLDFAGTRPAQLNASRDALEDYHVIVCLSADAAKHIEDLPYATVMLTWELSPITDAAASGNLTARLETISKELASEIRELMVTMRGAGAG